MTARERQRLIDRARRAADHDDRREQGGGHSDLLSDLADALELTALERDEAIELNLQTVAEHDSIVQTDRGIIASIERQREQARAERDAAIARAEKAEAERDEAGARGCEVCRFRLLVVDDCGKVKGLCKELCARAGLDAAVPLPLKRDCERFDRIPGVRVARALGDFRWIPVGERMPEVARRHLVSGGDVSNSGDGLDIAYYAAHGWWIGSDGGRSRPTHWMPLPEGPEVKL